MTKVIGSQSDVPDVGDPIVSPWHQDTAKKIVHIFPSTIARDAWTAPPDGAVCQAPAGIPFTRVAGVWSSERPLVDAGIARYPGAATVNGTFILGGNVTALPYATVMEVIANGQAACDQSAMLGVAITIATQGYGNTQTPGMSPSVANYWVQVSAVHRWAVPANGNPDFSLAVSWASTGGGTTFVNAEHMWHRYRA